MGKVFLDQPELVTRALIAFIEYWSKSVMKKIQRTRT